MGSNIVLWFNSRFSFCRRQIIQEERLKIIHEHAANLIGYLPKGILNEDDVPLIKDEALRKGIGMIK